MICLVLMLLAALIVRLQNISVPLGNELHSFRQTETAIVIEYFLKDGYSFFDYQMPILGEPWNILFEAPIYQSLVYFFMRITGLTDIDTCCKIISIIIFLISALVLFALTKLISDRKTALVSSAVYLFMPYTIYWSRAALVDYMSVLFALIYTFCLLKWLYKPGSLNYILALIFGMLAYLQKSSTMFPFVFFLSVFIIRHWINEISKTFSSVDLRSFLKYHKTKLPADVLLGIVCFIPALTGVLWAGHADKVNSGSEFTYWLTSGELHDWYYGTVLQRLDPMCWKVILDRLASFVGNWLLLCIILLIFLLGCKKESSFRLAMICTVSIFTPIVILFNLFYVHDYYMISITPFVAILLGILYTEVFSILYEKATPVLSCLFLVILFYAALMNNPAYMNGVFRPVFENNSSGLFVKSISDTDEKLIIEGEDWNPITPYYAERKCLMMRFEEWEPLVVSLLDGNDYQLLLGHDPEIDGVLLKNRDCVSEYVSSSTDAFIFRISDKNHNPLSFPGQMTECEKKDGKYDISDRPDNTICIEYSNIDHSYPVKIIAKTVQGEHYTTNMGIIALLSGRNRIMIDLDDLTQDATEIWFEGVEQNDEIKVFRKVSD